MLPPKGWTNFYDFKVQIPRCRRKKYRALNLLDLDLNLGSIVYQFSGQGTCFLWTSISFYNEDKNRYLTWLYGWVNKTMHAEHLAQCLAHKRNSVNVGFPLCTSKKLKRTGWCRARGKMLEGLLEQISIACSSFDLVSSVFHNLLSLSSIWRVNFQLQFPLQV